MSDEGETAFGLKLSDKGLKIALGAALAIGGLGIGSVGGVASDILGTRAYQDENSERMLQTEAVEEENEELRAQVAKMTELILNGCHVRQRRATDGTE